MNTVKKVIIISGTPGTGKTKLAKLISKQSNFKYVNVTKLIKNKRIFDSYDKKRKCYVVDTRKLNKQLIDLVKRAESNIILDSHLSHFLPSKYVNLCIITKCNLKELKRRLLIRKYSNLKIKENMESEIFNVCLNEAMELNHNLVVVDTSKDIKDLNIKKLILLAK